MANKSKQPKRKDDNRDPLSGEPGAHPVGVGVGTAVGAGVGGAALGAAAAGIAAGAATGGAMGTAAGPIGTVVGAVAGGVAGAYAGKSIAESIDPTAEDAYWRSEFENRPYYDNKAKYEDYQPAYQYGWESRARYEDQDFEYVEADLERDWQARHPTLHWDKAQHAVRDAWDRVDHSQRQRAKPH